MKGGCVGTCWCGYWATGACVGACADGAFPTVALPMFAGDCGFPRSAAEVGALVGSLFCTLEVLGAVQGGRIVLVTGG